MAKKTEAEKEQKLVLELTIEEAQLMAGIADGIIKAYGYSLDGQWKNTADWLMSKLADAQKKLNESKP